VNDIRIRASAEASLPRLQSFAQVAAWCVVVIATLALAGWAFDLTTAKGFHGGIAMNPVTAVLFILCGAASLLFGRGASAVRQFVARLLAGIVLLVGLVVLLRYAGGIDFGIDRLLFPQKLARSGTFPNQMAVNTAVAFMLAGLGLLLLKTETRNGFCPAQLVVVLGLIIGITALIGYAYRELFLYRIGSSIPMALNTAVCFVLLNAALLCQRPDRGIMAVITSDTAGGAIARRLLPAAVLIPAILGGLRLLGSRRGVFSFEEGVAFFAVANIIVFALLVWWNARLLHRSDVERERAEMRLKLQYTTTRVLSEAENPREALLGVLRAVCQALNWQTGAMWEVDNRSSFINCIELWSKGTPEFAEFETLTRQATFPAGIGLPGQVWAAGKPVWIPDVVKDKNFPRAPVASRVGLHGALGFPIRHGGKVLGVMEFFSSRIEQPDKELLRLLGAIGGQIGQFVERTHMERALRDSETLYHSLVETLPVNIMRKDLQGRITFGNKRYGETMGKTIAELIGKTDRDLFPPELAKKYVHDDRRVIETGEVFEDIEAHRRSGGEQLFVQVIKSPLLDARNKVVGIQTIFWDVTARKRAEQALEQTAAELARSNRELEQFAYVASHDLQEPLRMIAAYTQLLQRRYKDKIDREANEFIGYAVDGAVRMQKLIQDLLTYSRVGTRSKPFEAMESEKAFSAAVANLQIAIAESGTVITHDPLPRVCGDAVQWIQLFQNLLSNAIKFRSEKPPRIHVGAEAKQGDWIFSVGDNGIGIEPQYFRRIFVIFQRLHTQEDYPGTGIGLAVCKKIVERHGGRIWVESEPGQGATFFFTMPVMKD
jgi:PAS domain S-box-containing protein